MKELRKETGSSWRVPIGASLSGLAIVSLIVNPNGIISIESLVGGISGVLGIGLLGLNIYRETRNVHPMKNKTQPVLIKQDSSQSIVIPPETGSNGEKIIH